MNRSQKAAVVRDWLKNHSQYVQKYTDRILAKKASKIAGSSVSRASIFIARKALGLSKNKGGLGLQRKLRYRSGRKAIITSPFNGNGLASIASQLRQKVEQFEQLKKEIKELVGQL